MPDVCGVKPIDDTFLAQARTCAATATHKTAPNPKVGCVIVHRDGHVIATGVTEPAGGRHAERVALDMAGDAAAGATVYVTLEPCNHHGRTPPCTDALIQAGVHKVVYVLADSNPYAYGGAAALLQAGVDVAGPLDPNHPVWQDVARDLAGFFSVINAGRPHLTLKLAQDASGNTLPKPGQYLTGENARRDVHRLRARADAVLVGANTVNVDNPKLTVRLDDLPHDYEQPHAVIFDRRLQTNPASVVCRPGTILLTRDTHPPEQFAPFTARGVTVSTFTATGRDTDDAKAALATLAAHGVNDVLAEPGLTLAASLCAAGVVDTLVLHVANGHDGHFTPCVPLDSFTEISRHAYDQHDTAYTYAAKRKSP